MKIVKHVFLVLWTIWCIVGIAGNHSRYEANDWMFIIPFVATPYLILWYLAHRKASRKKEFQETSTPACPTSDASAQSDQNQVSEPNIVPMQAESTINCNESSIVPTTSYTETENMLYRSDGKEISTDEIPYLVHVACKEAIAKSKIPNTIHFILESYQLMDKTDDPETLCSRYNFASSKLRELTYYYHLGWYSDSAKISQYTNLFSTENYYKLIIQCYQRYLLKANQELKTKKGVENRINKFWSIIQSNVSAEVYKRLISQ